MAAALFRYGRWMSDTSRLLWKGSRTGLEIMESTDLASALMETAKNAVEDNLQDYFSQLKDCTKDSFLEELDDFNIEVVYRRLAANSVAFYADQPLRSGYE